jgi:hypothetical protein
MRPKDETRNQRESVRCPVTESRRQSVLVVGKTRLPVRLLDESAGGFAVLADAPPGVTENQRVQLVTDSGWFDVGVIYVRQVDPDDVANGASASAEGPWFRIGLCRLGEVESAAEDAALCPAGFGLYFSLAKWCPSNSGAMVVVGVLFTLAVIALPLAIMGTFKRNDDWSLKRPASWDGPRSSASAASGDAPFGSSSAVGRSAGSASTWGGAPWSLRDTARRLPGATPLTLPEVVRTLKLTDAQQEKIRLVIDATIQAVRDLDSPLQGRQRQELSAIRAQAFEESLKEALKVLDSEQRAQWEALIK